MLYPLMLLAIIFCGGVAMWFFACLVAANTRIETLERRLAARNDLIDYLRETRGDSVDDECIYDPDQRCSNQTCDDC